jgi:PiT family inorganic phosphate transporter
MHNTFVTPFDRDQINKLIQRMDDILDLMQDTRQLIKLKAGCELIEPTMDKCQDVALVFDFMNGFHDAANSIATVGKGIVDPTIVDNYAIFGALIGAIIWNIVTWYYGLPSSSSHALIGGMLGATIAKAGTGPLLAGLLTVAVSWICRRRTQRQTDRWFRKLQLVSSALHSIGHGSNDAQKTMGIIWLLLISAGMTTTGHLPHWVVIA